MSLEENKALDRRYVDEILNGRHLDVIDEICATTYASHVPGFPTMDRDGDKRLVSAMHAAFPDLRFTLEDQIADGDLVQHVLTAHGTHRAEFMGIPPTGRTITVTGMNINRIADGRIAESWGVIDVLGLMQQLGVVPAPGAD